MKECCRKYLDEQFGEDADVVGEIYSEYVSSVGAKLAEADAALAAADWKLLDHVAHTVKGNALAAGDADMAETAIALRKASALADAAEAASLICGITPLRRLSPAAVSASMAMFTAARSALAFSSCRVRRTCSRASSSGSLATAESAATSRSAARR